MTLTNNTPRPTPPIYAVIAAGLTVHCNNIVKLSHTHQQHRKANPSYLCSACSRSDCTLSGSLRFENIWYLKEMNLFSSAPLTNNAFTASPDVVVLWNSFQLLTSNTNAISTQFGSNGIGAHGGLVIVSLFMVTNLLFYHEGPPNLPTYLGVPVAFLTR